MFVHWGLYSALGGRWQGRTYHGNAEWIMSRARISVADLEASAATFDPQRFDAEEWVQLAIDAGMRHIVITAKHHEGFAMFKSEASAFNIVDATPFGRDPLRELADACAAGGVKLGFYYSQYQDWHEPNAAGNTWDFAELDKDVGVGNQVDVGRGDFDRYLQEKAIPQIRELLTNYGPVALIWFDTPGGITEEASRELTDLVHELQPDCLVNSRVGNGHGDYSSGGDGEVPQMIRPGLWESIDTHNDSWGYAIDDENWKSPKELARRLVRVAAKGGTYMLNVGPTGEGAIPTGAARILRELGTWIAPRREALYGTQAWCDASMPWGEITARDDRLYLHVLTLPPSHRIWLPGLTGDILRATVLGEPNAGEPTWELSDGTWVVDVPDVESGPATVIALDVSDASQEAAPLSVLNGIENALDAPFAELSGCALRSRRWTEKFGEWQYADVLTKWAGTSSSASWRVRTFEAGRFYLEADYAAEESAEGSELDVVIGDVTRRFLVLPTGHGQESSYQRGRFCRRRIGLVEFDGPGRHEVTLKPLNDECAPDVRIQRLLLTPAE
jgi:alpha-L-fucosidase